MSPIWNWTISIGCDSSKCRRHARWGIVEPVKTEAKNTPGYQWIVVDSDLLGGQPTVKGTRLSVSHILACLAEGMNAQDVAEDYPGFPHESLSEVLKFASEQVEMHGSGDDAAA